MSRRALVRLAFFGCILALVSSPARAMDSAGVRLGVRVDPDQLVLGTQAVFFDLTPDVRMRGTATLGFGDDITVVDLAGELHYVARSAPLAEDTYFYVGAGPDLSNSWFDVGGDTRGDTDLGLVLLGGIDRQLPLPATFFGEFRLHIHDAEEWFELHLGLDFPFAR